MLHKNDSMTSDDDHNWHCGTQLLKGEEYTTFLVAHVRLFVAESMHKVMINNENPLMPSNLIKYEYISQSVIKGHVHIT